jgi:bifunctional non-homologous end joining protein LigD
MGEPLRHRHTKEAATDMFSLPLPRHISTLEVKHDGYRFICRRDGDRVRVISRHGLDWTERIPRIVEALRSLRLQSATIDGEGVTTRWSGRPTPRAGDGVQGGG